MKKREAKPYERFTAWQACHELALAVYRSSELWPVQERFGLSAQARRAAFSAATNLVEGSARRGSAEFRRFLDISLGSLSELAYILLLLRDLEVLTQSEWGTLEAMRDHAGKLTWGLYHAVARRASGLRDTAKRGKSLGRKEIDRA
ncbi:MAG: four helix bundle protein [Gemmatimonadales bacterium]